MFERVIRRPSQRPVEWGPWPLEELPRGDRVEASAARFEPAVPFSETDGVAPAAVKYLNVFAQFRSPDVAPARAPVPDDLSLRTRDIKGSSYFLDASQVGNCELPESLAGHTHAVVILIEYGRTPEPDNLAHGWVEGAEQALAQCRAAELAVAIATQIATMGFGAVAHWPGQAELDLDPLLVAAGLGVESDGRIINPYLGNRFAFSVVTTDYALATDQPLDASANGNARGLRYALGLSGAVSGMERRRRAKRASHLSRYPMEQVKRVERPTTLIMDDEVPRVPKRAAFFERTWKGDLGPKAVRERSRFAFKTPLAHSMLSMIRSLVPHQEGPVAEEKDPNTTNPAANARAIKSLSYALGADLTGICEVPSYAWFSHKEDGTPIQPYHRYAIVMLIDQGYDTMEGASGDDWMSGGQSMRAYMRGGEIAGIVAEHLRGLGHPARSQTNADSDLLHIPAILWAGLGELSRIGELVLNPFVGPRFKSVIVTTDMPLEVDKPVDFGLQYFCGNCLKCARECPCDAISWGKKIMFNGYEMWKPDVERCTRYRVTNVKGAGCGRCMKTCPLNKVVDSDAPRYMRIASWLGVNAMWLKPLLVPIAVKLDDVLGKGVRNPLKKWWLDLEIVDGVCVDPVKGTNARDLVPDRILEPEKQKMAYYPASDMPAADAGEDAVVVDRKAALARALEMESPEEARARKASGEAPPAHYRSK